MTQALGSPLDRFIVATPDGPLRVINEQGFAFANVAAPPRCDVGRRGTRYRVHGGAASADVEWVCQKNAAGTYEWGAQPTLADPGADRITFWDDSTGAFGHLTPDSGDLTISGTTLALASAPTFSDFTNAQHDHSDADDGGTLTLTALPSITADAAELNILDGATLTVTELNYVDGVTSAIQTQLDGKAATVHTHALADVTDVTASAAEVNILDGATLTVTELNYVDGVTSAIQTQIDGKQPLDTDLTTLATAFASASASGPASLALHEDTDNGTNKVTLIAPATIASDKTATLQDVTGTIYVTGGTDVAIADGGTGQSTATAAFDALAPTTTQGDLIYHNGTDNVRLAKGTASQLLRMNAGATAPEWATVAAGSGALAFIAGASFSGSSAVNVDSCFTSTYDNYLVVVQLTAMSTTANLLMRLRAASSDATGASYYYTRWGFNSSAASGSGGGAGATSWGVLAPGAAMTDVRALVKVYGPENADETLYSSEGIYRHTTPIAQSELSGGMYNATTQFDGFTLLPSAGTITGLYRVYGLVDS
jgi:hypothetical protein